MIPEKTASQPSFRLLEPITGLLLVLVELALGWIIVATYLPEGIRLASPEVEVIVVLALLSLALLLVSLLALLHTRSDT